MKEKNRLLARVLLFTMLLSILLPGSLALAEVQPTITVTTPTSGSVVSTSSVDVSGYAANATFLRINEESIPIGGSGTFNYKVQNLSEGNNTIKLTASNSTYTTIVYLTVTYARSTAVPTISLLSPGADSVIYSNRVTVNGRVYYDVYNSYTTTVSLNGQPSYSGPCTGDFSVDVSGLTPGDNRITVGVTGAGTRVEKTLFIRYNDLLGRPNIYNLVPASGSVVTTGSIHISGTVTQTITNGLKINGTVIGFDGSGNFNSAVTLSPGNNTISLTVTDGVYVTTRYLEVRYDAGPVVVLTSPSNGAVVTRDSVTISGRVFNTQANGLWINNQAVWFNSSDGSFNQTIALTNLVNNIEIKAVNGSQANTTNLKVYYSGVPALTVTSHYSGDTVETEDVILEGTVFPGDPSEISAFTVQGVDCKSKIINGTFRTDPITLSSGNNSIELSLTANTVVAGGVYLPARQPVTRTIILNYNAGPGITVSSPLDGSTVYSNEVTIYGKLKKADFNTLKVGDKTPRVYSDGSFNQTVALQKGKNEIKLEAKIGDKTTTKTLTLNYDPLAKHDAIVKTKLEDGGEATAFGDLVKVKLAKGSAGLNTISVISVTDPHDINGPPGQSAFIGPVIRVSFDGDWPIKPYKVTLKYDSVVKENQSHKVSVFFFDSGEDEWKVLGGVVDPKAQTISIENDRDGYYAATMSYQTFEDVISHWAQRDIEFLVARGAVSGSSRNRFYPDSDITRAEFVTFLVKAMGIKLYKPEKESYDDVDDNDWEYQYVETALRAGIVSGVSHDLFAPDRHITREEAGVIIARAGSLKALKDQEVVKIFSSFSDANRVSLWARKELAPVIKAKIMNGSDNGIFSPQGYTTRAEAAAMIARFTETANKSKKTVK